MQVIQFYGWAFFGLRLSIQDVATMAQGSLTIVGSGIRSIAQFTLEAISYIEAADKVFYAVSDPSTEGFIVDKNKNAVDLFKYYDNNKIRANTYIQMAEVMLQAVRAGHNVVGVFYGHAGNFVTPSRRALTIARNEGHSARMLPAISAEDCLFADLLIDPSYPGSQTVEATDLVIRGRPLVTTSHVIIYQPGIVGQFSFSFGGIKNDKFQTLALRLQTEYGPNHPIVNYKAAISPLGQPTIQRYTIADLFKDETKRTIDATSTFYIPPKSLLSEPKSLYGKRENKIIAALGSYTIPVEYRPYDASPAMQATVERLSVNLEAQKAYMESPEKIIRSIEGLLEHEVKVLVSGSIHDIYSAMRKGYEYDPLVLDPPSQMITIVAPSQM
ncbi:hypothetical protein PT974_03141 [Cladobotryum mycophilum]|uniref:Tetrapyrrole methylase domain-containing protein n=1 Tax=Cladobotryum mycophilum TaxID=491253 RepID=A0ABR0SRL1_9HYPO